MDSIKREIFQLCCFFLTFHGLFLTILFISSDDRNTDNNVVFTCKKWWVPCVLSVCTSLVFVLLVQVKLCRYWKVWRQLQREKSDNRALVGCIQELRMKVESFDLSKEPLSGKRMKSSSVEIKWKPLTWCSQNLVTICLVCFAALVSPASKFMLCGFRTQKQRSFEFCSNKDPRSVLQYLIKSSAVLQRQRKSSDVLSKNASLDSDFDFYVHLFRG